MGYEKICNKCGAHLDPGERCDCVKVDIHEDLEKFNGQKIASRLNILRTSIFERFYAAGYDISTISSEVRSESKISGQVYTIFIVDRWSDKTLKILFSSTDMESENRKRLLDTVYEKCLAFGMYPR